MKHLCGICMRLLWIICKIEVSKSKMKRIIGSLFSYWKKYLCIICTWSVSQCMYFALHWTPLLQQSKSCPWISFFGHYILQKLSSRLCKRHGDWCFYWHWICMSKHWKLWWRSKHVSCRPWDFHVLLGYVVFSFRNFRKEFVIKNIPDLIHPSLMF